MNAIYTVRNMTHGEVAEFENLSEATYAFERMRLAGDEVYLTTI